MCTALKYSHYFGRNLDYEFSYGEQIVIAPRQFKYHFSAPKQYALIGMAHVFDNYPLFYDAMNEKGLAMAGLNFVGNTKFYKEREDKENVAPYDFIPWILSQCATMDEVKEKLEQINLIDQAFNEHFPVAQLHYMISDQKTSLVIECMEDGMHIYENPVHVLTNNPPFPMQMFNLNNYSYLSNKQPENTFGNVPLQNYSRGMGALGLPGDASSISRFVRASFIAQQSTSDDFNQFFHILHSVEQQKGICEVKENAYEYTIYSSCCDLENKIYMYTTYHNHQIHAVNLFHENLDQKHLVSYPLCDQEEVHTQN